MAHKALFDTIMFGHLNLKFCALVAFAGCFVSSKSCLAQPTNDDFADRTALTGQSITFSGSTSGATPDVNFQIYYGDPTIWWSWTASESSTVVIERVAPVGPRWAGFAVFTGNDYLQPDWKNVAVAQLEARGVVAIFSAVAGQQYQIVLESAATDTYTFRLIATNAPLFRIQPTNTVVPLNSPLILSAMAVGKTRPNFQWQFNGTDIPGATRPLLGLDSVTLSNAGDYRLVATIPGEGSSTSAVAHVEVVPDPQTVRALGIVGTNFEFSISGTAGRHYFVDVSSNLVDWPASARISALNTNTTSVFKVPANSASKFVRVTPYQDDAEICRYNRQRMAVATQLLAEEYRRNGTDSPDSAYTASCMSDGLVPMCPAGGAYLFGPTIEDCGPVCPHSDHYP